MKSYELSEVAQVDVEELLAYIAADDLDAAIRVDLQLHETFELLASFPNIGHHRPDLFPEIYRSFAVYSWFVIYLPHTEPLQIVRVWHGAQESPGL